MERGYLDIYEDTEKNPAPKLRGVEVVKKDNYVLVYARAKFVFMKKAKVLALQYWPWALAAKIFLEFAEIAL